MKTLKILFGCACFIAALNAQPAHAQLAVFTDRTAFDSSYPSANLENWSEDANNQIILNGSTLNGITYSSTSNGLPTNLLLTNYVNYSPYGYSGPNSLGNTNLKYFGWSDTVTFQFSQPLTAFAIDLNTYAPGNGEYTALLSNGADVESYFDQLPGNGYGQFIGFSDTTPFSSITIENTTPGPGTGYSYSVPDIQYLYASDPGGLGSSVVPEPSTIALMIVGLIGIAVFAIRRRSKLTV